MSKNRSGVSFTLTLVVAGVILIMTALSVITLGGSSIEKFFTTIGGQQEEAVTDAEVREACQEKAQTIQNRYCSSYIATVEGTVTYTEGQTNGGPDTGDPNDPSNSNVDDTYSLSRNSVTLCGETSASRDPLPSSPSQQSLYNSYGDTMYGYTQTASSQGCEWQGNMGGIGGLGSVGPTVTVQGDEFNCINEGHLQQTCPVR